MGRDQQATGVTAPRFGRGTWGRGRIIAACLLAAPVIVILFPSFLMLFLLMMPTFVALIIDRRPEKHAATSVGLLNFCGTLPPLVDLWRSGQTLLNAQLVLGDAMSWLLAFGGAAFGWLLILLATPLAHSYFSLTTQTRLRSLRRQQQKIVEEWGEEVAQHRQQGTHPEDEAPAQEATAEQQAVAQ